MYIEMALFHILAIGGRLRDLTELDIWEVDSQYCYDVILLY